MKELRNEIKQLKIDINKVIEDYKIYRPQIKILADAIKKFFEKQKVENYRLIEEITLLEKGKTEIQLRIYDALGYLNKLEKIVEI